MSEKKTVQPREDRRGDKPMARELRKAVVWSEVLDKPLARRKPRFR